MQLLKERALNLNFSFDTFSNRSTGSGGRWSSNFIGSGGTFNLHLSSYFCPLCDAIGP